MKKGGRVSDYFGYCLFFVTNNIDYHFCNYYLCRLWVVIIIDMALRSLCEVVLTWRSGLRVL